MPRLSPQFELERCPHCGVHKPQLHMQWNVSAVKDHEGRNARNWMVYRCQTCGGLVTACSPHDKTEASDWFPRGSTLDTAIPPEVSRFLKQAIETLYAPDGSIMLSASAVDAMLKLKNLREGSLYSRIEKAAAEHLITVDMAEWAHDVRLDANDLRHVDDAAPQPTTEDAKRVVSFAETLAEILFVLPERVRRGRQPKTEPVDKQT